MMNIRKYGSAPYSVAVLHGGPGAAGEMAPVAQRLSCLRGILEPFQTKATVNGQIQELADTLGNQGNPPFTLIGHSWGAWLAVMCAAHHPLSVRKIILVSSGPFEDRYVPQITAARLSRMNKEEKQRYEDLIMRLEDPREKCKDAVFAEVGSLLVSIDSYNPIPTSKTRIKADFHIFHQIWKEADAMRRSGTLLKLAGRVRCPVVAIHGEHDPHPFEGVKQPLSQVINEFSFIVLPHCGHYPWIERDAKKEFYDVLEKAL